MLILLILCCFLAPLRAAPIPSHVSNFTERDLPQPPYFVARTPYNIASSCLLTIFACVWKSAHPNINGPRDSGWTCFKRSVVTMLCALVAPELMLLWALRQHFAARKIAAKYNNEFAKCLEKDILKEPWWRKFTEWFKEFVWEHLLDWFKPVPVQKTRLGCGGDLWTKTHGFFIQMGGFILYENDYPKEVLSYERLADLLRQRAIDAPTVTERELQDRSKGDAVSKAISVFQTTWFVVECVGRRLLSLPLSELEVITIAFAAVNAAIYAVWWNKPQGVEVAIPVRLKTLDDLEERVDEDAAHSMARGENDSEHHEIHSMAEGPEGSEDHQLSNLSLPEGIALRQLDDHSQLEDSLPLIPPHEHEYVADQKESWEWLRRQVREDRKKYSSFVFLIFRLPYLLAISAFRPLGKMGGDFVFDVKDLRVPMFYAPSAMNSAFAHKIIAIITSIIGTLFGAVHLLAWTPEVPSQWFLILWRVSCVILTLIPLTTPLALSKLGNRTPRTTFFTAFLHYVYRSSLMFLMTLYIVARFVVFFLALFAIINPSEGVLTGVIWTSYLPHL